MEEQKVVDIRGYRVDIFKSILGICILALLVLSSIRYYQATSCQTRYNIAVHDSLKQRSDAQRDEADAQIKLLTANTHGDPVLGRIAITEYVDAIRKLEQVRSENPLPDNPNCGAF
jgi:hypothetical protein